MVKSDHLFKYSYGLEVLTRDPSDHVVLIERTVPYCIQGYAFYLLRGSQHCFGSVEELVYMYKAAIYGIRQEKDPDYLHFLEGKVFEDKLTCNVQLLTCRRGYHSSNSK